MFKGYQENLVKVIWEKQQPEYIAFDKIEEDTDHNIQDFVHVNGEFILKTDEKAVEMQKEQVRTVRNAYLEATDKYMIVDFPITEEKREQYKDYRQYLRDYTTQENWWKNEPKTFDEWRDVKEVVNDE